ncbi:MAG: FAD-dependent oxidoreductase [Thermoanaerobaculia bacterium]
MKRLTPPDTCDVAVIGAGLAGLECARRLCRAGLDVVLVDRKPDISRAVHTTGIFVRRTLEDFDLPESCLGPPIRQVVLHSPARRPLFLSSPRDEFRVGRMGALYDRRLVDCLNGGVRWSPETRLTGIDPAGTASRVSFSTRGRAWSVSARFVVGADGVASGTARALGLDSNRRWIVGAEDIFRGAPCDGPPRFHCFLDPDLAPGYLAWIVNDGEEVHLGLGGTPGRFDLACALELFRREAGEHVDLSAARLVERRAGAIPVGGILPSIASGRGLLVGDAAGATSPLTAGGLDACLRLSAFAASVIARHLAGDASALATYSGRSMRRRFRFRLALRATLDLAQSRLLVELGCFLLRRTPLSAVAREIFFGNGSFPDP